MTSTLELFFEKSKYLGAVETYRIEFPEKEICTHRCTGELWGGRSELVRANGEALEATQRCAQLRAELAQTAQWLADSHAQSRELP